MGEVVLSMEHVTHAFAGNRAVDDMSLQLRRGQIHALVGPNGAGKTTFVNLITGVYTLQEGASASVLGVDITGLQPHRIQRLGVARTFQTPQLFGDETALENVLSGFDARLDEPFLATVLRTGRVRRAEAEGHAKSEALLHQLGLGEHADSLAADLPYGLQRSLELARALGCDPEVLILDEPAAGLNPAETYALGTLLQQIAATGVAILLVEHDMSLVVRVADVVTCMERGGLIYSGDAAGLQHDERVLTAYLGPGHVAIDSGRSNEEVRGAHS
jgi:ABC-type branched-subunit amino acid transport system ATPase component